MCCVLVLPKDTTEWPRPELKPVALKPELNALHIRSPILLKRGLSKRPSQLTSFKTLFNLTDRTSFVQKGYFLFSITPLCYECYFSLEAPAQSSLLDVSLVGIEFREGGSKWLSDNVLSTEVKMTPLQVTRESTLDCMVYKKKVLYQIRKQS